MQPVRSVLLLFLLGIMAVLGAPDVAELTALRDQSNDRVIQLTNSVLSKFLEGRSRPYAVSIYFSAAQVSDSNPNLRLADLRNEYGLAAKALAAGADADKIFFFEAALETSHKPFEMLQVNALPCIVRIPPNQPVSLSGTLELSRSDKMLPDTIGTRDYPWPAETFIDFMGTRHGLTAAPIDRPSFYKSPMFPLLVIAAALAVGYAAYKMYDTGLMRHVFPWAAMSLCVFWFSVSGGMYNIIRGVPFFIRDRNGNLQFFLTGRQGQLGAEGFALGTLYMAVSLSIFFITFWAPRIPYRLARDSASVLAAAVAAGSLYQTFMLWTRKTGYRHVFYL